MGLKEDLQTILLAHGSRSQTPDNILADYLVACLAAYESKVIDKPDVTDSTEYLMQCLEAFKAASIARWRWHHVAVSLGVKHG